MKNKDTEIIGICGLGYIGLPTLAALANVGYRVIGCDIDKQKIERLQQTYEADIYEPGLNEALQRCKNKIEFTSDYEYLMENCSVIMITVGTPINEKNEPNYDYINSCIASIGKHLRNGQLIILKSTVTPGTTEEFVSEKLKEISGLNPGQDFYLAFCPERTIEGLALYELSKLPKIVGGVNKESTEYAAKILKKLGGGIVKVSSPKAAEICKITDNLFRAVNIALANQLGEICEEDGVDAYEVANAVNKAYNRTQIFKPGLGADGPCLSKDPEILKYYALQRNINVDFLESSIRSNIRSTLRIADVVSKFIKANKEDSLKISFIGLAFKGSPETGDMRGSPAMKIYNKLAGKYKNIKVSVFDPVVKTFFGNSIAKDLKECIEDANVILFLTNHPIFMNIETKELLVNTGRPLLIIDCWHNLENVDKINEEHVSILRVGEGWLGKKY